MGLRGRHFPAQRAGCGSGRSIRYLALGDGFTVRPGSLPAQAFPVRLAAGCPLVDTPSMS
jgi:hypothetical protein